jgi:hypothetical protein
MGFEATPNPEQIGADVIDAGTFLLDSLFILLASTCASVFKWAKTIVEEKYALLLLDENEWYPCVISFTHYVGRSLLKFTTNEFKLYGIPVGPAVELNSELQCDIISNSGTFFNASSLHHNNKCYDFQSHLQVTCHSHSHGHCHSHCHNHSHSHCSGKFFSSSLVPQFDYYRSTDLL